jgi:hypothetical protein
MSPQAPKLKVNPRSSVAKRPGKTCSIGLSTVVRTQVAQGDRRHRATVLSAGTSIRDNRQGVLGAVLAGSDTCITSRGQRPGSCGLWRSTAGPQLPLVQLRRRERNRPRRRALTRAVPT